MYKQAVLDFFGGVSRTAAALDITESAVRWWPDDAPIPERSAWRAWYESARALHMEAGLYYQSRREHGGQ